MKDKKELKKRIAFLLTPIMAATLATSCQNKPKENTENKDAIEDVTSYQTDSISIIQAKQTDNLKNKPKKDDQWHVLETSEGTFKYRFLLNSKEPSFNHEPTSDISHLIPEPKQDSKGHWGYGNIYHKDKEKAHKKAVFTIKELVMKNYIYHDLLDRAQTEPLTENEQKFINYFPKELGKMGLMINEKGELIKKTETDKTSEISKSKKTLNLTPYFISQNKQTLG